MLFISRTKRKVKNAYILIDWVNRRASLTQFKVTLYTPGLILYIAHLAIYNLSLNMQPLSFIHSVVSMFS